LQPRTGFQLSAQGCCTRLLWVTPRRSRQPQRGCGSQPRVAYSATLGDAEVESATPTGLRPAFAATQSRHISLFIILGLRAATPLGLEPIVIRPPRVAEYGNPGLRAATPFGVATTQVRVIQSPVVKLLNGPPDQGPCNAHVAKPAFNN